MRGPGHLYFFFFCRGVLASTLGIIKCFATSGSGDGSAMLEFRVAVSGITRLRKSAIAFVCVFHLISSSRN